MAGLLSREARIRGGGIRYDVRSLRVTVLEGACQGTIAVEEAKERLSTVGECVQVLRTRMEGIAKEDLKYRTIR